MDQLSHGVFGVRLADECLRDLTVSFVRRESLFRKGRCPRFGGDAPQSAEVRARGVEGCAALKAPDECAGHCATAEFVLNYEVEDGAGKLRERMLVADGESLVRPGGRVRCRPKHPCDSSSARTRSLWLHWQVPLGGRAGARVARLAPTLPVAREGGNALATSAASGRAGLDAVGTGRSAHESRNAHSPELRRSAAMSYGTEGQRFESSRARSKRLPNGGILRTLARLARFVLPGFSPEEAGLDGSLRRDS